ncbi:MAG TPA: TldD/PmbA family protein [Thermoanaerobaculia bacterium]|nr:TldD/PmbA family protein [Thermoanaerobaculia bacterium]
MRPESESFDILGRALAAATHAGGAAEADAAFISVDQNISRFANSQVHQNMSEESAWLALRVILDGAMGVATTTSFEEEDIAQAAAIARESARHSSAVQGFKGLYRANEPVPQVDSFDEATAAIAPMEKARALRTMFDRGAAAGVHFAGSYATAATSVACGNTHGIRRYGRMTHADATVIAISKDASGYATLRERRAADAGIAALGDEATLKATLSAGVVEDLEPGPYDVILEPPALAEVFEWMSMIAFTGQSYEDGSSFFVGNLGKRILGENVTLVDDSTTYLPFPFDMEGLPKRPVAIVENGVIRTPVLDQAWADRLGLAPTANAWHLGSPEHGAAFHLTMAGGDATREEMIASTKLGIWVTRFNYVNGLLEPKTALMTGTTRDGTFLIRDGKVAARLPNLRWTQSMVEALSNVESLSKERRSIGTWYNMFGGTLAPVTKIRNWNITGKQEMT